jgi:PadR family transcriptional regulator, regulatory protein PadR
MREPTYFVLAALLEGPLHGYAIIKRAEALSGGRVRLATGTLYTALDRLAADGQVELVSEERVAGRVRRSYGLTRDGATALRAEEIIDTCSRRLRAGWPTPQPGTPGRSSPGACTRGPSGTAGRARRRACAWRCCSAPLSSWASASTTPWRCQGPERVRPGSRGSR